VQYYAPVYTYVVEEFSSVQFFLPKLRRHALLLHVYYIPHTCDRNWTVVAIFGLA